MQKRKINKKEKEKNTCELAQLVPPPAWASPKPTYPCRLPQAAAHTGAWRACLRRRRAAMPCRCLLGLLLVPGDAQKQATSITPLADVSPTLYAISPIQPSAARVHCLDKLQPSPELGHKN